MSRVIVHADDYAISNHVSESIVAQVRKGAIQSVSIMPNMKSTKTGIELLAPFSDQVLTSVHLNLVEGRSVSKPEHIPMLVNEKGSFKLSWLQIMIKSCQREFRRQAGIEFKAQIEQVQPLLTEAGFSRRLRLDSHQHIHMIPGLFKTVCSLAGEYDIEYIRLTREPILPFIKARKFWKTYHVVNIAKNILLNLFSIPGIRWLKQLKLEYNYFFGLCFTGKMDYERVSGLIPLMPGRHDLELVVHAGRMLETEITDEYNKKDFIKEHTDARRLLEIETVERLNI